MRTIDDMIRQEVHYCVSGLVSTLADASSEMVSAFFGDLAKPPICALVEQAYELAAPVDDYEEAAIQNGWKWDGNYWCLIGETHDNPGEAPYEVIDHTADTAEKACALAGLDPYQREVFEHWLVSGWFAEKLAQHGEKVDTDFAGMTVWARTTTGQSISMDGVVQRIYREMMK